MQSVVGWDRRGVVTGTNMFSPLHRQRGRASRCFGAIANATLAAHLAHPPAAVAASLPDGVDATSLVLGGHAGGTPAPAADFVRDGAVRRLAPRLRRAGRRGRAGCRRAAADAAAHRAAHLRLTRRSPRRRAVSQGSGESSSRKDKSSGRLRIHPPASGMPKSSTLMAVQLGTRADGVCGGFLAAPHIPVPPSGAGTGRQRHEHTHTIGSTPTGRWTQRHHTAHVARGSFARSRPGRHDGRGLPAARAHAGADGPLELAGLTAQRMQVRAVGRAWSRAGATASPHCAQRP